MAVSHQWFIPLHWSVPCMIFSDISNGYNNVNRHWNNFGQRWTKTNEVNYENKKHYTTKHSAHDYTYKKPVFNEDIEERYNRPVYREDVDERLKKPVHHEYIEDSFQYKAPEYKKESDYTKYNDRTRLSGVTLWLTMLGLARTQSVPADVDTPPFNTLYKWKHMDFEFLSARHRRQALSSGAFIPANVLPLGVEVWGNRVWVTLPSWRRGVPATLATVSRAGGLPSPALKPYPNWTFHKSFERDSKDCSGLTSVFRMNIDQCGRLWVLDSGQINSQDSPQQLCPPSLVVFDVRTDKLVARYEIPAKYVLQDSLFSNLIVDTRLPDCSDLHVYIADTWRFGLLVFRQIDSLFWRFSHPLFYPDPLASNYSLHGINFQWPDGIFGLALTPYVEYEDRLLYFHSMASYREFYVSTSILQQRLRVNDSASEFFLAGESRGLFGQSSASTIDRRGIMYYGLVTRDSIGCWDTKKPYQKQTMGVVAKNVETLIFPNDVKVDHDNPQSVWVITNRLPMFQAGLLDMDDYNFRILYADTTEAVQGTVCDPAVPGPPPSSPIHRGLLP